MNCKQGDIAIIVRGGEAGDQGIGAMVECLSPTTCDYCPLPAWNARSLSPRGVFCAGNFSHAMEFVIHDASLRPINPGERERVIRELTPSELDSVTA